MSTHEYDAKALWVLMALWHQAHDCWLAHMSAVGTFVLNLLVQKSTNDHSLVFIVLIGAWLMSVHGCSWALRRSEIHVFQHSNKASPDFCGQVAIWTLEENKNSKFTLEAFPKLRFLRSIFKIKPKKNFFKICLVGTLNLCIKEPEKMQKSRNQSDQTEKTSKNWQKSAKF